MGEKFKYGRQIQDGGGTNAGFQFVHV